MINGSLARAVAAQSTYDAACKRVLSERQILACILHEYLDEFGKVDPRVIAEKYIEGEPAIGLEPVGRDSRARLLASEDATISEGTVVFDIRLQATVPGTREKVRIEIDVEAQNSFSPRYPLLSRAVYYCGRLLSMQGGGEVAGSRYDRVRKVYSIWVCAHPGPGFEGTVSRFRLEQSDIKGEPVYGRDQYDLLEVIMICLDEGSRHGVGDAVDMLGTLFDAHLTADEKIAALGDKFGIIVDEHFEGEVREMCNLSEGVFAVGIEQGIEQGIERGIERGIEQAIISSVRALMRTMGLTVEQALDALEIPGERRGSISEELADEA